MKPGAAAVEEEEKLDGTENEEGQEGDDAGLKPAGDQDPDGEGKSGEDGKTGEENEGEADQEEEGEIDPRDQKLSELEAEIKSLKEGTKPAEAAKPAPVVYSEEQKIQIAERFGVQEFKTVEAFSNMIAQGLSTVRQEMAGMMSQFQKDAVIGALSKQKEYADINRYREGIDEYLNKFSPQHHGNEEFIKDGLRWAKGGGLKKSVAKAVSSGERNRRIAGAARPAAPGGGGKSGGAFKYKLTASEESAFASFGKAHFKSKEDYAKSLKRYKNAK